LRDGVDRELIVHVILAAAAIVAAVLFAFWWTLRSQPPASRNASPPLDPEPALAPPVPAATETSQQEDYDSKATYTLGDRFNHATLGDGIVAAIEAGRRGVCSYVQVRFPGHAEPMRFACNRPIQTATRPPSVRDALEQKATGFIHHVTPIEYLPFILDAGELLSKEQLLLRGFRTSHFRRGWQADRARGFWSFVHCAAWPRPAFAQAVQAREPHVRIEVRAKDLPDEGVVLCAYNVARNRGIHSESRSTGRKVEGFSLPVAHTFELASDLLHDARRRGFYTDRDVEVLVKDRVTLSAGGRIICFSERDRLRVMALLRDSGFTERFVVRCE
jgi:hypothetical protein